jgi:hypothetical protein
MVMGRRIASSFLKGLPTATLASASASPDTHPPRAGLPACLAAGAHTRSILVSTPSAASGGIMKFAQKRLTCLGCKAPLPKEEATVCKHCKEKVGGCATGLPGASKLIGKGPAGRLPVALPMGAGRRGAVLCCGWASLHTAPAALLQLGCLVGLILLGLAASGLLLFACHTRAMPRNPCQPAPPPSPVQFNC